MNQCKLRKWPGKGSCDSLQLVEWKITKGIYLCKPASLNCQYFRLGCLKANSLDPLYSFCVSNHFLKHCEVSVAKIHILHCLLLVILLQLMQTRLLIPGYLKSIYISNQWVHTNNTFQINICHTTLIFIRFSQKLFVPQQTFLSSLHKTNYPLMTGLHNYGSRPEH